ncbi:hypothetical protein glysoja_037743 [Glycine soja]|uniref:Uncharacterized protein n=1 Tax=Glycine soja TaxID=3848 RepID=A0A0B2QRV5_GLYSO|nr:hypothetical protein glysoja_037743 [Glycine soja]
MLEAFQTFCLYMQLSDFLKIAALSGYQLGFTETSEEKCKEFKIVQLLEATGKKRG